VNDTAINFNLWHAFAALEALKAIKPKHDAISSVRGVVGIRPRRLPGDRRHEPRGNAASLRP
jgi:hypothetical protein